VAVIVGIPSVEDVISMVCSGDRGIVVCSSRLIVEWPRPVEHSKD